MLLPQEIYLFGPIYPIARPFDQCFSYWGSNSKWSLWKKLCDPRIRCLLTQSEEVFSAVESFELGIRNAGQKHSGIKYRSLKSDCLWPLKLNSCAETQKGKWERESHLSPAKCSASRQCCLGATILKGLGDSQNWLPWWPRLLPQNRSVSRTQDEF